MAASVCPWIGGQLFLPMRLRSNRACRTTQNNNWEARTRRNSSWDHERLTKTSRKKQRTANGGIDAIMRSSFRVCVRECIGSFIRQHIRMFVHSRIPSPATR